MSNENLDSAQYDLIKLKEEDACQEKRMEELKGIVGDNDEFPNYEEEILDPLVEAGQEYMDLKKNNKDIKYIIDIIEQGDFFYKIYPNGYERKIKKQNCKFVEDKLGMIEKAKIISSYIIDDKAQNVGVFGEWGTGKSTFLEYIKAELKEEKWNKIIDIKATEYSDHEKIWTYIFYKMNESVKKEYIDRIVFYFGKNKVKIIGGLFVIISCIFVFGKFITHNFIEELCNYLKLDINGVKKLFPGCWYIAVVAFILFKYIFPFILNAIDFIFDAKKNMTPVNIDAEKLGYKAVIKKNFDEMTQSYKNHRFIICVDELDRCNNATIMSFMEAIQLLEGYRNIQIIYAIDAGVILKAIEEAGFYKPHNYLKKYFDLKCDLVSINSSSDCIRSYAKEYDFIEEEIEEIVSVFEKLEINIAIRELINILNSLSELKESWIKQEIISQKYRIKDNTKVLNWFNTIPIAVAFFAGSLWPNKIREDFRSYMDSIISVSELLFSLDKVDEYENCPQYLKQVYIRDLENAYDYFKYMPPIYRNKR